ncbi:TlpA family protein disulfide reductase [Mucilaginibacter sp. HD30]
MKKMIPTRVLAALCLFLSAGAAAQSPVRPLQPGDAIPALTFTRLVNSRVKAINTQDYKDQLLIIDFWSTWCTSCIKMFPAVEELQQQFKGKVTFLAIDSWPGDTQPKLKALFARHPEWHFPTVYGDSLATRLFPHQAVPFYVWIKNNQLLGTTGTEAIDADTITAVLAGRSKTNAPQTITVQMNRPLYQAGNGGEPASYTYRSLLTPYAPQLRPYIWRDQNSAGQIERLAFVNQSAYTLITAAFPETGNVSQNRIMTGTGVDSGLLHPGSTPAWKAAHLFTYEAIFPPRSPESALALLQEDLRRYFNLKVDSTTVERECLVFTTSAAATTKTTRPDTAQAQTNWYTPELNIPITLTHCPLSEALQLFDEVSALPVLNETTSNPVIDLRLKKAAANEAELRPLLQPYGITFRREKRKILTYVIRQATETVH